MNLNPRPRTSRIRGTSDRGMLRIDGRMPLPEQRRAAEQLVHLATEPAGVRYSDENLAGVPCRRARPPGPERGAIVQYLHGGYAMCSLDSHRRLAGHLALATGVPVLLVGYRLAPEHLFPAAVDDSVAVYRELLRRGVPPGAIAVAGESAGGGLALATLVAVREGGLPLPSAAALMSPWIDLTVSGASILGNAGSDPFVQGEGLRVLADQVLGGADPRQPLASPLFADLARLPDLLVQVTADEVLLDDARRLTAAARAAGVRVIEEVVAGVAHAFQLAAGRLPEADAALARLGEFLRTRLAALEQPGHM